MNKIPCLLILFIMMISLQDPGLHAQSSEIKVGVGLTGVNGIYSKGGCIILDWRKSIASSRIEYGIGFNLISASQSGFLGEEFEGVGESFYITRDYVSPFLIAGDMPSGNQGLVDISSHDWNYTCVFVNPLLSAHIIKNEKYQLSVAGEFWFGYGSVHETTGVLYGNFKDVRINGGAETEAYYVLPIEHSTLSLGYGFSIDNSYVMNDGYSIHLSIRHGELNYFPLSINTAVVSISKQLN
jgi:hypothetical protein